jgi:esterase/lipase superfamily enzyme
MFPRSGFTVASRAIDARYRTIASAGGRGIAGLSEGGYGALNIGLHHPGEFGLLESWSGYMTADNIPAIFGHDASVLAYNSPARWITSVASQVRAQHTYIWFYCGAGDPLAAVEPRLRRHAHRAGHRASVLRGSGHPQLAAVAGADAPGAGHGVGAPEPWIDTCAAAGSSRPR